MSLDETDALHFRQNWIQASKFENLSNSEVLNKVKSNVKNVQDPVIILDLDSTLYEVAPRTQAILKEWLDQSFSQLSREQRQALDTLHTSKIGYSLKDTFGEIGLDLDNVQNQNLWHSAKQFWQSRFFSNNYLKFDVLYPGAREFVNDLWSLGAKIVYLTGRDALNMHEGTVANFLRDGLPWNTERTALFLKPKPTDDDLSHKQNAAIAVKKMGSLVAQFENEPANFVALYDLFPEAMHVFLETVSSDKPARPIGKNAYLLKRFD